VVEKQGGGMKPETVLSQLREILEDVDAIQENLGDIMDSQSCLIEAMHNALSRLSLLYNTIDAEMVNENEEVS